MILAALEAVADEVGDRPDEADNLAVPVQLVPQERRVLARKILPQVRLLLEEADGWCASGGWRPKSH